jgi:methylphosphotriester-DNA--protein-cysteine methyltransferase
MIGSYVRETGLSFARWRRQVEVVLVVKRLAGGASIQSVAANLGCERVSSFMTTFKKDALYLAWALHGRAASMARLDQKAEALFDCIGKAVEAGYAW